MSIFDIYSAEELTDLAKKRFAEERSINCLKGWFFSCEIKKECDERYGNEPECIRSAKTLREVLSRIPLSIGGYRQGKEGLL